MNKYLVIKADENDGDYVTQISIMDENEYNVIFPLLSKVAKALKKYRGQWPTGDMEGDDYYGSRRDIYNEELKEHEMEEFGEFVPSGECGVHTIDSVKVLSVINEESLF